MLHRRQRPQLLLRHGGAGLDDVQELIKVHARVFAPHYHEPVGRVPDVLRQLPRSTQHELHLRAVDGTVPVPVQCHECLPHVVFGAGLLVQVARHPHELGEVDFLAALLEEFFDLLVGETEEVAQKVRQLLDLLLGESSGAIFVEQVELLPQLLRFLKGHDQVHRCGVIHGGPHGHHVGHELHGRHGVDVAPRVIQWVAIIVRMELLHLHHCHVHILRATRLIQQLEQQL
mmetsp:Transcript_33563/g.106789  ORF Transcript_33563/g.106789 Transcript_33563/m.106789 type:complete len:230 (-) Transcript_33563:284-973(-)